MMLAPSSVCRTSDRRSQVGATLIEVMVCLVLVAVFMLGMNMFWISTVRQFDDLALRQKAIFRLNSEMERLAGMMNDGTPFTCVQPTDYATVPDDAGSYLGTSVTDAVATLNPYGCTLSGTYAAANRFIYGSTFGINWLVTSVSTFATPPAADDTDLESVYRHVLVWDAGTGGNTGDDRNLVWLDADRAVVAQISWDIQDLRPAGGGVTLPAACYNGVYGGTGTTCRLLTLYLDYPFRFADTSKPRENTMGPVETITLQTIVGWTPWP